MKTMDDAEDTDSQLGPIEKAIRVLFRNKRFLPLNPFRTIIHTLLHEEIVSDIPIRLEGLRAYTIHNVEKESRLASNMTKQNLKERV